ncbi:MAG TPA: hypothetical protein PLI09_09955 [Candidatus Hydrogenedentes bacterium]|nr:hypothetical protein [Candidatus Hydrogenedentota bacterium]
MKELKDKILELADIAKACPDNLQAVCFETLLKQFLAGLAPLPVRGKNEPHPTTPELGGVQEPPPDSETKVVRQEDIRETDLHVKVKRFLQKETLSLDHINALFYREADKIMPLYEDLKTTRMTECQIRIALLQCFVAALAFGEFETDVESIRTECTQRKCYDSPNFAATFKNNSTLFDFGKFDRTTKKVRLSDAGRKELADIIKELL